MKRLIFIVAGIAICCAARGQYKDVEKFPQKLRDSILVDVANKAIDQYSIGYLRPGAVPVIEDMGPLKELYFGVDSDYLGVYLFAVYYKGTEEEHNYSWYNKEYLVRVLIRADNCKPINIRYIDDANYTITGLNEEKTIKYEKRRFVPIEEREEERKRRMVRTVIVPPPNDYWKKFDERVRHVRDSLEKEGKRKAALRRKAAEEKRRADSLDFIKSGKPVQ